MQWIVLSVSDDDSTHQSHHRMHSVPFEIVSIIPYTCNETVKVSVYAGGGGGGGRSILVDELGSGFCCRLLLENDLPFYWESSAVNLSIMSILWTRHYICLMH